MRNPMIARLGDEAAHYNEWTGRTPNVAELGCSAYSRLFDELEAKAPTLADTPRRYEPLVFTLSFCRLNVRIADWVGPHDVVVGRLP